MGAPGKCRDEEGCGLREIPERHNEYSALFTGLFTDSQYGAFYFVLVLSAPGHCMKKSSMNFN